MSSDARINASRQNGKFGGPKSDRGRARSATNATKYGVYARKAPVLSAEDQGFYDQLSAELLATHAPQNRQEEIIVEQLVATLWRLDRYETAQEYFIENEMSEQADGIAEHNPDGIEGDLRISLAIHHIVSAEHSAFRELQRIIARFHRTQQRLLRELKDLQGPRFNKGLGPKPAQPPVAPHLQQKNTENEPRSTEESTPPAMPVIATLCRARGPNCTSSLTTAKERTMVA
jgi:hypothetical protein